MIDEDLHWMNGMLMETPGPKMRAGPLKRAGNSLGVLRPMGVMNGIWRNDFPVTRQ